jgi:hypothetical protein
VGVATFARSALLDDGAVLVGDFAAGFGSATAGFAGAGFAGAGDTSAAKPTPQASAKASASALSE